MIASICLNGGDPSELLQPGVAYTVRDSSGKELYTSYHGENYVAKLTDTAWFYGDGEGAYDTVTVTRYLLKDTAEMGWSLQLVGQAGSWYRQWPARLIGRRGVPAAGAGVGDLPVLCRRLAAGGHSAGLQCGGPHPV